VLLWCGLGVVSVGFVYVFIFVCLYVFFERCILVIGFILLMLWGLVVFVGLFYVFGDGVGV